MSASTSTFDVSKAPSRFPALQQEQVFMDNAGGSQILDSVIESIKSYYVTSNVQLGATYAASKSATAKYESAYEVAARFINASPNEICLGASTTQLLHNLSTTLEFHPGDELILSKLNHEANVAPWARIADGLGLVIKWWGAKDPTNPVCELDELRELLSEKTRLVACPHASNITGTITGVREIADLVHSVPRALLCVDGVALAPHRPVDVKELDVDIYTFSWYKVYGPHISQLYVTSRIHTQITSLAHFFKHPTPNQSLDLKLNLASANYELTQGIPEVVNYLGPDPAHAWDQISSHEETLQSILLDFLNANGRITVYGEKSASRHLRVPVISFTVAGVRSQAVVGEVERRSSFGFRSGHMYSYRLLRDVAGLGDVDDGVVRVSLLHYNTVGEVRGLVKLLQKIIPSE